MANEVLLGVLKGLSQGVASGLETRKKLAQSAAQAAAEERRFQAQIDLKREAMVQRKKIAEADRNLKVKLGRPKSFSEQFADIKRMEATSKILDRGSDMERDVFTQINNETKNLNALKEMRETNRRFQEDTSQIDLEIKGAEASIQNLKNRIPVIRQQVEAILASKNPIAAAQKDILDPKNAPDKPDPDTPGATKQDRFAKVPDFDVAIEAATDANQVASAQKLRQAIDSAGSLADLRSVQEILLLRANSIGQSLFDSLSKEVSRKNNEIKLGTQAEKNQRVDANAEVELNRIIEAKLKEEAVRKTVEAFEEAPKPTRALQGIRN